MDTTKTVEAVARELAVDEYADRHGIDESQQKIAGTDHFERWFAQSRPSFERVAKRAIAAMPAASEQETRSTPEEQAKAIATAKQMDLEELVGELVEALQNAKGFLDTPVRRRKYGEDWMYKPVVDSVNAALTRARQIGES